MRIRKRFPPPYSPSDLHLSQSEAAQRKSQAAQPYDSPGQTSDKVVAISDSNTRWVRPGNDNSEKKMKLKEFGDDETWKEEQKKKSASDDIRLDNIPSEEECTNNTLMQLSSSSSSSAKDPFSNPFTLHHSDNPTAVLVSPPLNGDNYITWYRSMRMDLRAKNKPGFVDGTITSLDFSSPTYDQWVRVNDMVTSWLIHSMVSELAASIIYADTAQAIWKDLHECFSQSNSMKIYEVKKTISECLKRELFITTYYTCLKVLWDELASYIIISTCSCGAAKVVTEILHQDHVMQFLQGLNDGYSAVRSQILLQATTPNIE